MKLHITISKYHSWYLCQTWLQIMLLYTYTNFTNRKNPAKPNYHIMSRSWTSRLWDFYIMFLLGASLLMFVTIFMIFSLVRNFTNFTLSLHHFMINYPQNRLVWSGSQHMIVWFMGFFSICEVYWKYRTPSHLVFWKPGHWGSCLL